MTRKCGTCGETKSRSEFYFNAKHRSYARECKTCKIARARKWQDENPDKFRAAKQRYRVKVRHGLLPSEYDALLEKQGGVCAICGEPPGQRRLAVDHDHACCPDKTSCGKCIRGLLCTNCNTGLGSFRDDPARLSAASAYLSRHPSVSACYTETDAREGDTCRVQ